MSEKHTATIYLAYDLRSSEVLVTFVGDAAGSDLPTWFHDERSTPSKLSSVLALLGIEWVLRSTAEDAGLTQSS